MSRKVKGTAINNIEYTGIVTISQYTKGKKNVIAEVHNVGGKPLFNFLADCLLGDYATAANDRPIKILLLNIDDNGNKHIAESTTFISLLAAPEKIHSEDSGRVRYSFIIPQEYFAAGSPGSVRFNAIGLYANSATGPDDYAAYCEVDTSNWSISMTSVIVLDWELHISN